MKRFALFILVAAASCTAATPSPRPMAISSNDMPALGPYVTAVAADQLVFLSGVVPFDYSEETFAPRDIGAQTRQALVNLEAALAATGLDLDDVVKVTVFLRDARDFPAMNDVYSEHFDHWKPARTTVPGVDWGRDDLLIEIEAIAARR